MGQGGPVNTADILEQLKKMREDLQKQINGEEESTQIAEKEEIETNTQSQDDIEKITNIIIKCTLTKTKK